MFNRTVRMIECGLQPVYVFDGKPPTLKVKAPLSMCSFYFRVIDIVFEGQHSYDLKQSGELARRSGQKKKAEQELREAQEAGDQEAVAKYVTISWPSDDMVVHLFS